MFTRLKYRISCCTYRSGISAQRMPSRRPRLSMPRRKMDVQLGSDSLERRDVMAASLTASFSAGVLKVEGTDKADSIYLRQSNGIASTSVSVDNIKINDGGKLVASIAANRISKIEVRGLGGNDVIALTVSDYQAVSIPSTVWGGSGNDTIYGGAAADTLYGNAGEDTLYGKGGNDFLSGGTAGVDGATVAERDHMYGGDGFDTYADGFDFNKPVYNGLNVDDVQQNGSPTCATLASIAAATASGTRLDNQIKVLGNNKYEVNLYGLGKQVVTFNGTWTDNDADLKDGIADFWVTLIHRARFQAYGIDVSANRTDAQWDALNDKNGSKLFNSGQALYDITGWKASYTAIGSAGAQNMADALARGDYIVASSFAANDKSKTSALGIVGSHAYAVTRVYKDNGVWKVRLYNPWGSDAPNGATIDGASGTTAKNDGFITLTWAQFTNTANFRGYFVA